MKKALKYVLPIALAGGLLYWTFKGLDFQTILSSFKEANYFLVALGGVVAFLAHASRGIRWGIMLKPLGYKINNANATAAVLIGYITNLVFPRAGEVARSAALQKTDNVPFEKSFGAVIAERVIDVFMLFFLLILNLLLEFSRIKDLVVELIGGKLPSAFSVLIMVILFFIFIVASIWSFKKFKDKLLSIAIFNKIYKVVLGLWDGFSSIFKLEQPLLFIAHTFFIWGMYFLSTYLLCKAFPIGENISYLATLTIVVMGSIGMAAPTLGGIGSYHFLVGKIVVLYGLSAEDGIALATFLHSMQGLLYVVLLGLGAMIYSFIVSKKED